MLSGFGQEPLECLQERQQTPQEDPRTLQLSHSMIAPSPRTGVGMQSSSRQDLAPMGYHPASASVQPQEWMMPGQFTRPSISPTNSPPVPHPMWDNSGSAASGGGGCGQPSGGSTHPWATLSTQPGQNLPPGSWSQMTSTVSDSPMGSNTMHMNSPAMAQGPATTGRMSYMMGQQSMETGSGQTYAAPWTAGTMAPMPSVQGQIAFPALSTPAPGAMSAHEQSMWNHSQMRADAAPYVPGTYGSGVQAY